MSSSNLKQKPKSSQTVSMFPTYKPAKDRVPDHMLDLINKAVEQGKVTVLPPKYKPKT